MLCLVFQQHYKDSNLYLGLLLRLLKQWTPSLLHLLPINRTCVNIIRLPIKWIKIPWPICLHSGILNKKLLFYNISDLGNFTGKNRKKNDCLTSCYIKRRTQPYLGNIKLRPISVGTNDYDSYLLKQFLQYLIFVFLPLQK